MPITQSINSKANVKRQTTNDLPFNAQQPVINSYYATSTAGQTVINFGFSIQTTGVFANTDIFWLFVDGKKLDLGSSNDYTFTNVGSDGTSSQVTLNFPLVVNLNIQAFKLGLKPEIQFGMDNRFTQLYANQAAGFQGFVSQTDYVNTATTTAGTPAAGTFYSSIIGRAPMVDLSQDMKSRLGIERWHYSQLLQLQNEFGPNGEPVYGVENDPFGQVRFVGISWLTNVQASLLIDGPGIASQGSLTTNYIEITFYGTGLNLLMTRSGGRSAYFSVDGGTETLVSSFDGSVSSAIQSRNYNMNVVYPAATGLSLGIHTVKIRDNASNLVTCGFEVVNQVSAGSNLVSVNPGIVYNQGQKSALTAQSTLAYNAAVSGTTGGRVVEYITAAGVRGQAFTQNASSSSTLSSASHTNEEVARVYTVLEFSASRTDDFSSRNTNLWSSGGVAAFTLDDDTTTLVAGGSTPRVLGGYALNAQNAGDFWEITFVGTGIDVVLNQSGATNSSSFILDGTSLGAGSANLTQYSGNQTKKVASGLPYGTHTLKCLTASATNNLSVVSFTIYQPKTPSIPSGAVQIGSYNVMANYSVVTSAATGFVGTGTMRKVVSTREAIYNGTWGTAQDVANYEGAQNTSTTTPSSTMSFTFWGTGFEWVGKCDSGTVNNATLSIDGSSVLTSSNASPSGGTAGWTGALTTSLFQASGGASFTPSSGLLAGTNSATQKIRIQVSGLTLGLHTIKWTTNSAAAFYSDCVDVITPIHSPKSNLYADFQNTLTVGSNAISDDRQITPIKNALPATKAWAQAVGVSSSPNTNVTAMIPLADMSCTVKTSGGPLQILFSGTFYSATVGQQVQLQIYVDGIPVGLKKIFNTAAAANNDMLVTDHFIVPATAGYHKIDMYWASSSTNAVVADQTTRNLSVREL